MFPLQDATRKQMIHVSPLLKSGAGPRWGPRCQSHEGEEGVDSCITTSFIALRVLWVMLLRRGPGRRGRGKLMVRVSGQNDPIPSI